MLHLAAFAQGWPADYDGVMLQGFYWDSYDATTWTKLQAQADELSDYFQLIWVPQSGWCNSDQSKMGYTPVYYFNQSCSFGSEKQLRDMIAAFKERGTGIIADVVINHRDNMGGGGSRVDYPAETYNGVTYQMSAFDICADDNGGQTANWGSEEKWANDNFYAKASTPPTTCKASPSRHIKRMESSSRMAEK